MSESLHERLRTATARAHHALEGELDWQARIAELAGYRGLLARLRGFHAAYERAIGQALADEAFFGPRRRLGKLDADLAWLGLDQAAIQALPGPPAAGLDGRPEAMGALYVLEGSTLGGTVIGRQVERIHGFDENGGCAYYRGHGRATGSMWAAFRQELETLSGDAATEAAALRAGIATFDALRLWIVRGPASSSGRL